MTSITTRAGKGTPLTHTEVDDNFTNLNADKLEASNNLSDVSSASAARTNLGLGTAATTAATDYATAAQGSLADSALQSGDNVSTLTNDAGYTTNVGDITNVSAGTGLSGGGASGTVTISHADTSSQGSVNNSGTTVIQDITLDTYGHITALGSTTLSIPAAYTNSDVDTHLNTSTATTDQVLAWTGSDYDWVDVGGGNPASTIIYVAQNTAPTGYLKANGAAISRTTYADLFAAIGTTFGTGDGSTTFNVPDLRGEFIRAWDDARGIDSGRSFGSAQADEFESHNHVSGIATNNDGTEVYGALTSGINTNDSYSQNTVNGNRSGYTSTAGGTETRPRNIALLACIKY